MAITSLNDAAIEIRRTVKRLIMAPIGKEMGE
jgi:hypothetical protein